MTTYKCKCGSQRFAVNVIQCASIAFDEDGDHYVSDIEGDVEWTEDSVASCFECDANGPLSKFAIEVAE